MKPNEQALTEAVAKTLVAVAVAADSNFQHYASGVLSKCGNQLNHGVLLSLIHI